MSLRTTWRQDEIRALISPVLDGQEEARVKFTTFATATKFRYALYSFRRRMKVGRDLSFVLEEVLDDDGKETAFHVIIKKTPVPI